MQIDWNTPVSELYHGDNIAYVDLDEDELFHWKYIKREKLSNGKYRYYYDQSELDAARGEYETAQKNAWRAGAEWGNAKETTKKAYENKKKADIDHNFSRGLDEARKTYNAKQRAGADYIKAQTNESEAERRSHAAYDSYKQAEKKYKTKKITSFPRRTIAKGAVKVANILSGVYTKKRKNGNKTSYSVTSSLKTIK